MDRRCGVARAKTRASNYFNIGEDVAERLFVLRGTCLRTYEPLTDSNNWSGAIGLGIPESRVEGNKLVDLDNRAVKKLRQCGDRLVIKGNARFREAA
jgi:hypothetical protein